MSAEHEGWLKEHRKSEVIQTSMTQSHCYNKFIMLRKKFSLEHILIDTPDYIH